jgi:hypothetical protein
VLYLALYGILTVAWLYRPPAAAPHATDYLTEKAQALGFDRNRIVAYTRDQVPLDGGYQGALRGAPGTL